MPEVTVQQLDPLTRSQRLFAGILLLLLVGKTILQISEIFIVI